MLKLLFLLEENNSEPVCNLFRDIDLETCYVIRLFISGLNKKVFTLNAAAYLVGSE